MSPQPTTAKHNRGDRMTTAWMAAALLLFSATIVGRTAIPQSWWLSIHILTLGVLTNAILQWSWYFSRSLLRLRRDDRPPPPTSTSAKSSSTSPWSHSSSVCSLPTF